MKLCIYPGTFDPFTNGHLDVLERAATKGLVIEADLGGKVKTFVQMNAIGWLLGARMMAQDFGHLFPDEDRWIITFIHYGGMGLYALAAVLTITSGISYFRRHGHVVLE